MKKLLIALLLLSSCATVRRNSSLKTTVTDSTRTIKTDSLSRLQTRFKTVESSDTTIGIKARSLTVNFSHEQIQPLYNSKGIPVTHTIHKDTAGLHVDVTVSADSGVSIRVGADSVTMVIKGLKREKDSIVSALKSFQGLHSQKSLFSQVESKSETVIKRGLLAQLWPYLLGAVLACLAFLLIRFIVGHYLPLLIINRFRKNGKNNTS